MSRPNPVEVNQHHFLQIWILLISIVLFGLYIAGDRHFLTLILELDRSYMAALTMALVVAATAHCGWHVAHASRHIAQLQSWLNGDETAPVGNPAYLRSYLNDLDSYGPATSPQTSDDNIVEIHAERIRSPADLGWFFVDLAVRLGLLGTIIGFIMIFASLSTISIEGGDDLKDLLIAMSGGMGTALLTTLTGLIGASILSFQYLILGRETEHLAGLLLRVKSRYQASHANADVSAAAGHTRQVPENDGSPPTGPGSS